MRVGDLRILLSIFLLLGGCAAVPSSLDDPSADADTIALEAQKAFHQGRLQQGINLLRTSLSYNRGTDRLEATAQNLNDLGVLSISAGEYAAADRYLQEALTLYTRLGDKAGCLDARLNLASLKNLQGPDESLFAEFKGIEKAANKGGFQGIEASAQDQMGQWMAREKKWKEAKAFFESAVKHHRGAKSQAGEAVALHNLADVEMQLGLFSDASGHCKLAIAIDKAQQWWPALGDDLFLMGRAHEALKQTNIALGFFERAFYVFKYTANPEKMDAAREGILRSGGESPSGVSQ